MKQRDANCPHLPRSVEMFIIYSLYLIPVVPWFPVSSMLLQAESVEDVHLGEERAVIVGLQLHNKLRFFIANLAPATEVNISKPSGAYCFA